MSFFSRLIKKNNSDPVLALDIGTEVVKALVFQPNEEAGNGVVLGVGKIRQRLGNMQSGAVSDISGVIETAREAIDVSCKKANMKKVKKAIVGIAGELVKGTTTTVHYERINPETKIDITELKSIINKVQAKAYEKIKRNLAWETGQEEIDIKLINAAIVDVRIDGYGIKNPLGFQGRDVSISIFNAYAPMIHLGALETIAEELEIDLVSIAAEPYAVACSVGISENDSDFNAIFIDIGGGTTDIAIVRNGGLEGTKMFALGGRAFTKRLSYELGVGFEEAENIKIQYSTGRLTGDTIHKVEQILEEDCFIWLSGIEISLAEFSENDLLPSKILLCGGGSALPGIKKALMSSEWIKNLQFAKAPTINFLQPRDLLKVKDSTGELNSPQDVTPMGLANLVLEMTNEEKMLAGILRKAVQNVQG